MPTALVTGTSTGIGFATALHLARHGYRVHATMRSLAKAEPLRRAAAAEDLPVEIGELDVTDPEGSLRAVDRVLAAEAGLDVLVNNAGIGGATPLELVPEDEHHAMFEANYFGPMRLIRAVLPAMRERGSGAIVNVSSLAGRFATPNQVPYSASKWALEGASEALAHELRAFGIRVVLIEPGVIQTAIFENSAAATRYDRNSPYRQVMRRNGKFYAAGFKNPGKPEQVAETILEAVTTPEYRLRWPVGRDAETMIPGRQSIRDEQFVELGGELSDEEYNGRFARYFGVEL